MAPSIRQLAVDVLVMHPVYTVWQMAPKCGTCGKPEGSDGRCLECVYQHAGSEWGALFYHD